MPPLRSVCVFMWLPPFSSAFGPAIAGRGPGFCGGPGKGPAALKAGGPFWPARPGAAHRAARPTAHAQSGRAAQTQRRAAPTEPPWAQRAPCNGVNKLKQRAKKKGMPALPACFMMGAAPRLSSPFAQCFILCPAFAAKPAVFFYYTKEQRAFPSPVLPPKTGDPGGPFWAPGLRGAHAVLPPCGPGARRRRRACKWPKNQGARPFFGACGAHRARRAGGLCGGPGAAVAQAKRAKKTLRKLEEKQPGPPAVFFAFCPACGLRLPRRAQARAGPMPARPSGAKWCRPAGAFRTARARPFWGAARPQWARPRRPAARPA